MGLRATLLESAKLIVDEVLRFLLDLDASGFITQVDDHRLSGPLAGTKFFSPAGAVVIPVCAVAARFR